MHVVLASEVRRSAFRLSRLPITARTHRKNFPCPNTPVSTAAPACRVSGTISLKENEMAIGTVKFFNSSKGFGFISPDGGGKDVFVHATAVEAAGLRTLSEGQKVNFDIQPDARGSKAANLSAV